MPHICALIWPCCAILWLSGCPHSFDDEEPSQHNPSSSFASINTSSSKPAAVPNLPTVDPTPTQTQQKIDDRHPATSRHNRLGIILGASLGSFVVVTALCVYICYLRRRRLQVRTGTQASQTPRPFMAMCPQVPQNGVKELTTENSASESRVRLREPTDEEGAEEVPPAYSQHSFFLRWVNSPSPSYFSG